MSRFSDVSRCARFAPMLALFALALTVPASVVRAATPTKSGQEQTAKPAAPSLSTSTPKGFLLKTIKQDGQDVRYVVYIPADYDASKAWPAILFLHGSGETGSDGLRQVGVGLGAAILRAPDKWPFVVIIPQKPPQKRGWDAYDDLLMAMLDTTKKDYNVDSSRLYLTGLSMGGYGTWALGAKHPALFAALVPICGGGNPSDAAILKNIPIWAFHGEADNVVPTQKSRDMVDAIKAAGGADVMLTTYPGVGHNSWDNAYGDPKLSEWLLQHKREAK